MFRRAGLTPEQFRVEYYASQEARRTARLAKEASGTTPDNAPRLPRGAFRGVARYVGGPLDGQTIQTRGRWVIYRDDTGRPLSADKGDRELDPARQPEPRRFYMHVTDRDGQHLYIHLPVLDGWRRRS